MMLSEPEVLAILKSILVDDLSLVEQRFGFEFQDVDLRMSTFGNLSALARVIQERKR